MSVVHIPPVRGQRRAAILLRDSSTRSRSSRLVPSCTAQTATETAVEVGTTQRFEFDTRVAQKCIRFENFSMEEKQMIVVSGVRGQSPLWDAGIRPGDQLTGISDTNRDEVWELDDMASLRFVYLCLQMRIPRTITMDVRKNERLRTALEAAEAAEAAGIEAPVAVAQPAPPEARGDTGYLDQVLSSMGSDDEAPLPPATTVSEAEQRLVNQQKTMQEQNSRSQQRIRARKDYLSQVGDRNDAPFIATVLAAFVLPALVILTIAFASGYLDQLSGMYRS